MRAALVSRLLLVSALASTLGSTARGTATHARTALPFIADDYAKAVAEAKARKVPLFIESWAPW